MMLSYVLKTTTYIVQTVALGREGGFCFIPTNLSLSRTFKHTMTKSVKP